MQNIRGVHPPSWELTSWWMLLWEPIMHKTFELNVDLYSIDVDDIASPTLKLSDVKRHASLLSSFLFENYLYFSVDEIICFQKLVENLDKIMTNANLGRQNQRSLDYYFKSSWEYLHLFEVISYYFIPSILLKLIVYIFKLILLLFLYSHNNTTTLWHLSHQWEDDTFITCFFKKKFCCVFQTRHTKEGEQ